MLIFVLRLQVNTCLNQLSLTTTSLKPIIRTTQTYNGRLFQKQFSRFLRVNLISQKDSHTLMLWGKNLLPNFHQIACLYLANSISLQLRVLIALVIIFIVYHTIKSIWSRPLTWWTLCITWTLPAWSSGIACKWL